MNSFERWLRSLLLVLGIPALTMGCQVLFGDFKVGDHPSLNGGQGGGSASGGSGSSVAGADSSPSMGPIIVVSTGNLYTSDLGAQARFYVSLTQKPAAAVSIPVTSLNLAEGTVSPANVSFTRDDWNAPQAVTVTGEHDTMNVGNQPYSVLVGPASSPDPFFEGATATVSIVNIDNDNAGFFVMPTQGLITTEAGGNAFFDVVLTYQPSANVVIDLKSSEPKIGTVSPSSLAFTPENWGSPQRVTVTGADDEVADGDHPYQIMVGPVTSDDHAYAKLPVQYVSVKNSDNDHAGVMVTLGTGTDPNDTTRLRTSESGDSATFTVVLNKAPDKDVTIGVKSSSDEGTVSPEALTFTALNWNAPQKVTVVGVDNESVADGNQPYQIKLGPVTTDDPAYGKLTSADLPPINVVNFDNDTAHVTVTLLTGLDPNDASALLTSENGTTAAATFSLVLSSKPKFPVHFSLSSTNDKEGTVSPAEVDFTDDNWNKPRVVKVTGVNDEATKDGNAVYAVRISSPTTEDLSYQKLPSTDVKVVNLDDDVAALTPPKLLSGIDSGTKLVTNEGGGSATFSISLTSKPRAEVKLPVVSSNGTEGKVTPTMLTFTLANYAIAQVVTVTGQPDDLVDGDQAYTVTVGPAQSDDANYAGLSQSVKVTNRDDDSAYIVPSPGYSGTTAEKNGGAVTFGISLHSQPTEPVTLSFASSNEKEGKVAPASLTFTSSNWFMSQNITVTGVDDSVMDGDQGYTIQIKGTNTADPNYKYAATTLNLTNKDDDLVGLKITSAANPQTTEAGGKVTFTVALTSEPTGNVSVAVSSGNIKEGTVSPASLPFTAGNWSMAQTVTVTGVDDSVVDGNQTYAVTLKTAASSADAKYAQLAASSVSISNKDDDVVGVTVAPTTCATTPGTTATFSVVLKSQPLGPVSIALSSDTPTEGKVTPALLSFTASTWNVAQTVTVTGVDDGTMGMMTEYKIVTAAASSSLDTNYNGFNPADVACVNSTPAPPPVDP